MNKKKYISIVSSIFFATILCTMIIFLIKYQLEIKPASKQANNSTKTNNDITANVEEESSTNELPLDERRYEVDGKTFSPNDILKPCSYYNNSIIYNNSSYLSDAYPDFIVDYLVKASEFTDVDSYIFQIHHAYTSIFGEYFVINNTISNITILDETEVEKMNIYYNDTFFSTDDTVEETNDNSSSNESKETLEVPMDDANNDDTINNDFDSTNEINYPFNIQYAVLVESQCFIQYTDAKLSQEMKTDSETEYFICYYAENTWYIDYLYTDYYFYN